MNDPTSYIYATALAIVLVSACILVHVEMLRWLARMVRSGSYPRLSMVFIMHGLLFAHVFEIWIFGVGHKLACDVFELGLIVATAGQGVQTMFDYAYYSAMIYTTVGFGDLIPTGAVRMITSAEAVAGLALIAWSASFTFMEMRTLWRRG